MVNYITKSNAVCILMVFLIMRVWTYNGLPDTGTVCAHGEFYSSHFQECTRECPTGYFGNYQTASCEPCDPSCYYCFGPSANECSACFGANPLILLSPGISQCSSACSSTLTNLNGYRCNVCTNSKYNLYYSSGNPMCTGNIGCPALTSLGYFDQYCFSVPSPCTTSLIDLAETCTRCPAASGYFLYPLSSDHKLDTYGNCVNSTPAHTSYDSNVTQYTNCRQSCSQCDATRRCSLCSNGMKSFAGSCSLFSCPLSTTLNGDSCDCSEGYFPQLVILKCLQCDPACKACYGPSPSQCSECNPGYLMHPKLNYCRETCQTGYYFNGTYCVPCNENCYNCTGPTSSDCDLCRTISIKLSNRTCVTDNCAAAQEMNSLGSCINSTFAWFSECDIAAYGQCINCYGVAVIDQTGQACTETCTGYQYNAITIANRSGTAAYLCAQKTAVSFTVSYTGNVTTFQITSSQAIDFFIYRIRTFCQFYLDSTLLDSQLTFVDVSSTVMQVSINISGLDVSDSNFTIAMPDVLDTSMQDIPNLYGFNYTHTLDTSMQDIPNLHAFNYTHTDNKALTTASKTLGTMLSLTVAGLSLVNSASTLAIRASFVTQIVQFFILVNTTYPDNVDQMLTSTRRFPVSLSLPINLPNIFSFQITKTNFDLPPSIQNLTESPYFLDNAGSQITTIFLLTLALIIVKITNRKLRNSKRKKIVKIFLYLDQFIQWNFYLSVFCSNYLPMAFYLFLQTVYADTTNAYGRVSIAFTSFWFFFGSACLVLSALINYRVPKKEKVPEQKEEKAQKEQEEESKSIPFIERFTVLYEDFKTEKLIQRLYITVNLVRSIIFCCVLVYAQNSAETQASLTFVTNFMVLVYSVVVRPFKKKRDNVIQIANEFILTLINICVIFLVVNDANNPNSNSEGFAVLMIMCDASNMILNFLVGQINAAILVYQFATKMREAYRNRKARLNQVKPLNFASHSGLATLKLDESCTPIAGLLRSPNERFRMLNVEHINSDMLTPHHNKITIPESGFLTIHHEKQQDIEEIQMDKKNP